MKIHTRDHLRTESENKEILLPLTPTGSRACVQSWFPRISHSFTTVIVQDASLSLNVFQKFFHVTHLFSSSQHLLLKMLKTLRFYPAFQEKAVRRSCQMTDGEDLVRTTLGSWRSRSWSTALGAGLWYSFVSGPDRINLGGLKITCFWSRGGCSMVYHRYRSPQKMVRVFGGGKNDDVVEK